MILRGCLVLKALVALSLCISKDLNDELNNDKINKSFLLPSSFVNCVWTGNEVELELRRIFELFSSQDIFEENSKWKLLSILIEKLKSLEIITKIKTTYSQIFSQRCFLNKFWCTFLLLFFPHSFNFIIFAWIQHFYSAFVGEKCQNTHSSTGKNSPNSTKLTKHASAIQT